MKFTRDGRGFVNNTSTNTISEIDAVTLEEVRRIEVGSGPRGLGLVPGDAYALVSNSGSDSLSIVDLELNVQVAQLPTGRDPRHMAITPDGRFAYVCIWGDGYIAKFDISGLTSGDVASVTQIARIDIDATAHPYSLNIERSGRFAFVANTQADYVSVIDTASDTVSHVDVGSIGGRAVAFTLDNRHALVTLEAVSHVAVIDIERMEMVRRIPVGPGPRGIAVDPADGTFYISNFKRTMFEMRGGPDFGADSLTLLDADLDALADPEGPVRYEEITVGFGPCSVALFDPEQLDEATRARRSDPALA